MHIVCNDDPKNTQGVYDTKILHPHCSPIALSFLQYHPLIWSLASCRRQKGGHEGHRSRDVKQRPKCHRSSKTSVAKSRRQLPLRNDTIRYDIVSYIIQHGTAQQLDTSLRTCGERTFLQTAVVSLREPLLHFHPSPSLPKTYNNRHPYEG